MREVSELTEDARERSKSGEGRGWRGASKEPWSRDVDVRRQSVQLVSQSVHCLLPSSVGTEVLIIAFYRMGDGNCLIYWARRGRDQLGRMATAVRSYICSGQCFLTMSMVLWLVLTSVLKY